MATTVSLPPVIATYFDADRADDIDTVVASFSDDAQVHDEQQDYVGHEAIRAWKLAAQQKYQYTSTPLSVSQNGELVVVHSRLEGTFPGSPVEVDYHFGLRDDRITSLRIG
jgi:ketosteroid isomerase-like protein